MKGSRTSGNSHWQLCCWTGPSSAGSWVLGASLKGMKGSGNNISGDGHGAHCLRDHRSMAQARKLSLALVSLLACACRFARQVQVWDKSAALRCRQQERLCQAGIQRLLMFVKAWPQDNNQVRPCICLYLGTWGCTVACTPYLKPLTAITGQQPGQTLRLSLPGNLGLHSCLPSYVNSWMPDEWSMMRKWRSHCKQVQA